MANLIFDSKRLLFPGGGILNYSQSEPQPEPFQIEITTTSSDQEITIPHLDGYTYNYTVDYGDNTTNGTVTTYNDPDTVHTYTTPGTYTMSIRGTCETFYVNNGGTIKNTITKILNWGENIGFKIINFYGCVNLSSLVTDSYNAFSGIINNGVYRAFRSCTSLITIPSGLFNYCTNVNNFHETFRACTSLTTVPNGLFDNNTLVNDFGGLFNGCSSLTTIPIGLFDNNTLVDDFWATFYYSGLETIPDGLFDNNTLVTTFYYTFEGTSITSIPTGLFDNNTNVTTFENTFRNCSSLTGSSGELWLNPSGAANYTLTGPNYDSGIPNGDNCYFNSTGLSDYASIPTYWK